MSTNNGIQRSFSYAIEGFQYALKREPNFRIHIITAIVVCILSFFLNLSNVEWIILILIIGQVIILELINTSIEAIVNHISPEYSVNAKIAKDVAATAVFAGSIIAILVGAFLFIPKIILYMYF